jgi:hypothetical protein
LLTYYKAVDPWDDQSWYVLVGRNVELARENGALTALQFALNARIVANAFMGELAAGSSLMAELYAVCEATGSHLPPYSPLALAAWRGRKPGFPSWSNGRRGERWNGARHWGCPSLNGR